MKCASDRILKIGQLYTDESWRLHVQGSFDKEVTKQRHFVITRES